MLNQHHSTGWPNAFNTDVEFNIVERCGMEMLPFVAVCVRAYQHETVVHGCHVADNKYLAAFTLGRSRGEKV